MKPLKRVFWKVGQPLLPSHLVAQENALIAQAFAYYRSTGLPYHGVALLNWDDTLLTQGIVSISKLLVIFPSGEMIDYPGNSVIESIDLNKTGKTRVTIYLHLLTSESEEEDYLDSGMEHEKLTFSLYQLVLSDDHNAPHIKDAIKLAEFEKDLENRWKLCLDYLPPLLSVHSNPFFKPFLIELKTKLEHFQNSIELISTDNDEIEGHTLETRLCLLEIAKMRRFLLNIEHKAFSHPYHLYEALSQYLDTIALLYRNYANFKLIPYQHEKLGPLMNKMMEALSLEDVSKRQVSHIEFNKKERCYVSEKLPGELGDAKEVYLIIQKVDSNASPNVEGVKLSAYSRLMNAIVFGVQGIPIIRIERAPFNHGFSKRANIYSVEKGVEWDLALKEGRLAFDYKEKGKEVQAFLYWR